MSSSTTTSRENSTITPRENNGPGRYVIAQPAGAGLTMLVDTVTGRSWFRIAAGTDHYAWRPMKFEPSAADLPSQ
jgi:hypothetical protein